MWNFSIIVPREFGKIVYELYALNKRLVDVSFAQTIVEEECSYRYIFATSEGKKGTIFNNMIDYLSENIVAFYKSKFLKDNIKFDMNKSINNWVFFKSLLSFDFDLDKQEIKKSIANEDTIFTDSLIMFRHTRMLNRWRELCCIANENFFYLHTKSSFSELMKFLMSNIDYRTNTVNVYFEDEKYIFFDNNNKLITDYLLDYPSSNDEYLLGSLVALSPQKIIFHFNIKDIVNKDILFDLFKERIEI